MNKEIDILIVGGGLIGATLMLALRGLGYSTLMVDEQRLSDKINPDFDARSLALSPASQHVLNMLHLWEQVQQHATDIAMIHVSDQHQFGVSRLHAKPNEPLGYVVEMQYLHRALHQHLDPQNILAPAKVVAFDPEQNNVLIEMESERINIKARLIVAADGAQSTMRRFCALPAQTKSYVQHAIVANIGLAMPHQGRAYERFTTQGPMALLPMQDQRMSLVWAMSPKEASKVHSSSDTEFLSQLQKAFGYRLGRFIKVGQRVLFPLHQVLMPEQVKWPVVFVGNAAHTLHPVAGQGFNLGLRDVAALAQCIAQKGLTQQMVHHYLNLRKQDQQIITRCTDGLINVFTSRLPGLGVLRGLGLMAIDNVPFLKNSLIRYASGYGGIIPDLVCDIALQDTK